jgi:PAS domain S-box-containing protein
MKDSRGLWIVAQALPLPAVAFVIDRNVGWGIAAGVLYLVAIWTAYRRRVGVVWATAVICSVLTILVVLTSPLGTEPHTLIANRGLALLAIWLTACLVVARSDAVRTHTLLASIVESSDDAIIGKTLDGTVTSWNRGAERLYGYTADEMIGGPVARLVPPDRPDEIPGVLQRLRENLRVERYETVRRCKDGSLLDVSLTISPIKDQRDRLCGASTIARDISGRKRAEEAQRRLNAELARSNEALEESNMELRQFAYVASHDLQTPLRQISGFLQLLRDEYEEKVDAQAREWIAHGIDGANRMHALIRDLLTFSRVESRSEPFGRVALKDVVDDALDLLGAFIEESGARVTCDELPTVSADRSQMVHLLMNLIDNGIKYRGDGLPHVHLSAEKRQTGTQAEWIVSVRDNGIGIDPRHSDRIFEIFQRLHTQQAYPGTGIGLAVCRRIAARHGGRIWVESAQGGGATFYFTLPGEGREA